MSSKRWALKYDKCQACGTTEIKHYGYGHCYTCYAKLIKPKISKAYRLKHKKELQEYFKKYHILHREKKLKYHSKWRSKRRFNNLDTEALKRAEDKCEKCGITNNEHLQKYGTRLNIHHVDNTGRKHEKLKLESNNKIYNLRVLCVSCHTVESNKNQNYEGRMKKAWETRRLRLKK